MKKFTLPFALVLLLNLAGCLPVSQNPLSPLETAEADPRLTGLWYGKSGEDEIFLHMVPGKTAEMQIVEVDHEKTGAAHTTLYAMFPSVIDDRHYMNIREGKDKPFYLARYHITANGALSVWLMSDQTAAKAIKAGRIKGTVKKTSSTGIDVSISDTSAHLAAFVRKSDPEKLFDQKFGTFQKVTLPAVQPEPTPQPTPSKKSAPSGKKKKSK